jgi:hypothetical protein
MVPLGMYARSLGVMREMSHYGDAVTLSQFWLELGQISSAGHTSVTLDVVLNVTLRMSALVNLCLIMYDWIVGCRIS